ncbi:MAG: sensor histidine kinase [Bacteroidetes bacterium]|nr:sensor histidine kinase [Bacteroidota bacterium]
MVKRFFILLVGWLLSLGLMAQPRQRLSLQLAMGFMEVVTELRIDLDSGLVKAAHSQGISRLPVMAEGFEKDVPASSAVWIDRDDPVSGKRMLEGSSGLMHARMLLLLGAYYVFSPGRGVMCDSALVYLVRAEKETAALHADGWWMQSVCLLGKCYMEGGDTAKGMGYFRSVIERSRVLGDRKMEAKAWTYAGIYTPFSFESMRPRIGYLQKALELYRRDREVESEIITLQNISYMSFAIKDLQQSDESAKGALRLEDSIGFFYTHYTSDLLSLLNHYRGYSGIAIQHALRSVKSAESVKDSLMYGYAYARIGYIYSTYAQDYEDTTSQEARYWLTRAVDWFMRDGAREEMYKDIVRITNWLYVLGRSREIVPLVESLSKRYAAVTPLEKEHYLLAMAEGYRYTNRYDSAGYYYQQVENIFPLLPAFNQQMERAPVVVGRGWNYLSIKEYQKVKSTIGQFVKEPGPMLMDIRVRVAAQLLLYKADSALGDTKQALDDFREYKRMVDSSYKMAQDKLLEEFKIQYESDQREKQLGQLQSQSVLQQRELHQATVQRRWILAALVAMLVIVGLVYNQYRSKQRSNQLLEAQKAEIDGKNRQLEWLLREVHHRVKNNLQVMMSLLNLQSVSLDNQEAVDAIRDSKNRLHAMSMIHQKLYQGEDVQRIDMKSYINEYIRHLYEGFYKGSSVRLELELIPLQLDVIKAVPLGLILNEALTNAFKYAFSQGAVNVLQVRMWEMPDGMVEIVIHDNGKGLPAGFDWQNTSSLGMYLMRALAEQIDGEFDVRNEGGVRISIQFSVEAVPGFRKAG